MSVSISNAKHAAHLVTIHAAEATHEELRDNVVKLARAVKDLADALDKTRKELAAVKR